MSTPGGHPPGSAPERLSPSRPAVVDAVAALLVFGGLFGIVQLVIGDFVITGQLPAKGPIVAVAAVLYVASALLGIAIRTGRGWLAAVNLAGLFGIVYLAAFGQPVATLLGVAHAVAAVLLLRTRRWFVLMASWRVAQATGRPAVATSRAERQPPARAVKPGRTRPSRRR
ncbi:MAG: hypothetical protein ABIZ30_06050 [Candidatus Limnocylindrales bacterium]